MAIYKKTYKRYDGALTPEWSRFLVIGRYAFEDMHRSRFLSLFFLASFIYPVICALTIYFLHNLSVLNLLNIDPRSLISINERFFMTFLGIQSMLAYFLATFTGPGLVSPDLANNALPLYLARPFSRYEYVLGKMSVLLILLSLMTWIPGLLLFLLQGYLAGGTWMWDNLRIAGALFAGAWIWILILSLLALALSAWVKWRPVAGALMFGVFFVAAGFGGVINEVLRTRWGALINISHLMGTVWLSLFDQPLERGSGAVFFRVMARGEDVPVWCSWAAVAFICLACLYLLSKRVRGAEVVR